MLDALLRYGLQKKLIEEDDLVWARNSLLAILGLDAPGQAPAAAEAEPPLAEILSALTDSAVSRGVWQEDQESRGRFDTALMGALTPRPAAVRQTFFRLYQDSPQAATAWV